MRTYTVSRTELWTLATSGFIASGLIGFAVYVYKLWNDMSSKTPPVDPEVLGVLYSVMFFLGTLGVLAYGIFIVIIFRVKREHGHSFRDSLLP